jgi:hypothetical protein
VTAARSGPAAVSGEGVRGGWGEGWGQRTRGQERLTLALERMIWCRRPSGSVCLEAQAIRPTSYVPVCRSHRRGPPVPRHGKPSAWPRGPSPGCSTAEGPPWRGHAAAASRQANTQRCTQWHTPYHHKHAPGPHACRHPTGLRLCRQEELVELPVNGSRLVHGRLGVRHGVVVPASAGAHVDVVHVNAVFIGPLKGYWGAAGRLSHMGHA